MAHTIPLFGLMFTRAEVQAVSQWMSIGIVGEYIGKTFIQSKNRPLFTVEERIGLE